MFFIASTTIVTANGELDQYHHPDGISWYLFPLSDDTTMIAQSFEPTKNKLTMVSILIGNKNVDRDTDDSIILSIRTNLDGRDLISSSIRIDSIAHETSWVSFSFKESLTVKPGKSYFIVCRLSKESHGQDIGVQAEADLDYEFGEGYVKGDLNFDDNGWNMLSGLEDTPYPHKNEDIDFCFRTYGHNKKSNLNQFSTPIIKNILAKLLHNHPNLFLLLQILLKL
jgi:hypothetical protein